MKWMLLLLCVLVLGEVCADSTDMSVGVSTPTVAVTSDEATQGSMTATTTTTTTSTSTSTPTDGAATATAGDAPTDDDGAGVGATATSTSTSTPPDASTTAPSNDDNVPTTPVPTTATPPSTPPTVPSCTANPPQCATYSTCGQCTYQHCRWCDATQSCLSFSDDVCPSNITTFGQTCPNTKVHLTYATSVDNRVCGTAFGDHYREPTPFFTFTVPRDIGKIVSFHLAVSSTSVVDPILVEPWDSIHVQMQAQRKNCAWHDIAYSWDLLDQSIIADDNSQLTSWNVEWTWDPLQGRYSWTDDGKLQLAFQSSKGFVIAADCMHDVKLELSYEYIPHVVPPCQWDNQCVRTNAVELEMMEFQFNQGYHMTIHEMTWMMACVVALVATWL